MNGFPRTLRHGADTTLFLDPTRLLLAFRERQERDALAKLLREVGLRLEDDPDPKELRNLAGNVPEEPVNHTDRRFWVRTIGEHAIGDELYARLRELLGARLQWIGPVYGLPGAEGRRGLLAPLPHALLILPRPQAPAEQLEKLMARLAEMGLKEDETRTRYLAGWRYLSLPDPEAHSVYALREQLEKEERLIQHVRLETMPMLVPIAVEPGDPLYAQQWDMVRIGASGPGLTGWDLSVGDPAVVAAVLDEGCDLAHPDLHFSTPGINLGTMMPDGSPTGNHGTACAGIVAGVL